MHQNEIDVSQLCMYYKIDKINKKYLAYLLEKKRFWSRGLVKSRQNKWRGSRSRETEVGEKIAVTNIHSFCFISNT